MKKTAKRILAIVLCVLMVMSTCICVFATSKEETKTYKLFKQLKDKKEVTVTISDSLFDDIADETGGMLKLSNAKVEAKLDPKDIQIAASVTLFNFLKVKGLYKNNKLYVYIPLLRLKANITDIIGAFDMDEEEIYGMLDQITGYIDLLFEVFDYLELVDTGNKSIAGYNAYCESFTISLKKALEIYDREEMGELPADFDYKNMTEDEIKEYFNNYYNNEVLKPVKVEDEEETYYVCPFCADREAASRFDTEEECKAHIDNDCEYKSTIEENDMKVVKVISEGMTFVYKSNGDIQDIILPEINEEGEIEYTALLKEIPIESISFRTSFIDFLTPIFYFELSGIVKRIIGIIENF